MAETGQELLSPVTVDRDQTRWVLRLRGEIGLARAAELRQALMECAATGRDFEVDLEQAEAIDLTVLQLLWAAVREAAQRGAAMGMRASEAVTAAGREAGFDQLPGWPSGNQ